MALVREELFEKYDRPGPRYTSYPTAPVWTDSFGPDQYRERLRVAGADTSVPMSLYVHLPFCESMCWYCACNVIITQDHDKASSYVDDVLAEAKLVRDFMGGARPVVQHHWGGGTPTFLPPDQITRLFAGLGELFPLGDDAEVSIEVDPRVTTTEHLEALTKAGFNRISMGVQDFNPVVQEAIHRVQSYEDTRALVDAARGCGFESVNLDVVYGLPHQTVESFTRSLEQVLTLQPDRVACYAFAHVPWLKKHQRVIPEDALPRGREKLALYLAALDGFQDAGYLAIGMDHFALRSDELAVAAEAGVLHRNFMGYTTRPASDMVSFGVTAISEVAGSFAQNHKDLRTWREDVYAGRTPVERGMLRSEEDERRRRLILDLMCRFRIDFAEHGGEQAFRSRYPAEVERLEATVEDGLVEIDASGITVTNTGRLFVRNLAMAFDAYLKPPDDSDASTPRFSRTV